MLTPEPHASGLWGAIRRHPVMLATLLGCTLAGAVLGYYGLTDDWSIARRLAAGAQAGAGTGLLMTGTKWIG